MPKQPCPDWLTALPRSATHLDVERFLSSPIVLYPGAGSDGHPLRVFARAHAAHCFLYADYAYGRGRLEDELEGRCRGYSARARGYHTHARIDVDPDAIVPKHFVSALPKPEGTTSPRTCAVLEVLERDDDLDDAHGPVRLALLFAGLDGYDVFEHVFVRARRAPLALVLQEHGLGGNYDRFGRGGRLDRLAVDAARPRWALVGGNTEPWSGYEHRYDCGHGGMHWELRSLYERVAG